MISPPHMRGQMELYGEVADLQALRSVAAACGCTVEPGPDQKLWLGGDTFDGATTPEQALDEATKALALLNGFARMENSKHRNVDAGDAFVQNGRFYYCRPPQSRPPLGTALWVSTSPLTGGLVAPLVDPTTKRRRARMATDPKLRDIVAVLGEELSWHKLRLAFEKIWALLGNNQQVLIKHKYATEAELDRFNDNAHDPRLSGTRALHSYRRPGPLSEAMTEADGLAFIVRLLSTYVDKNP